MGWSGCFNVEYCFNSQSASGKFPSGKRLGAVYGCNHSGSKCTRQTGGISSLGKAGTDKDTNVNESQTSYSESTTSKPIIGIQRIFWMQAFQSGKCIPAGAWNRTNWLANWKSVSLYLNGKKLWEQLLSAWWESILRLTDCLPQYL